MARRRQFTRLGDHHLGVESPFKPRDETEGALFEAIGAAKDADVLKATLRLSVYQMKRSAHEALIRHGVPQRLLDESAATFAHVRTNFAPDTEPRFAANLLVAIDALEMRDDPRFLAGSLSMFVPLKLFYEMGREFRDGPILATERKVAPLRKDGGIEGAKNRKAKSGWKKSDLDELLADFRDFKERHPERSVRSYVKDYATKKWKRSPDTVRKILGQMLSQRPRV